MPTNTSISGLKVWDQSGWYSKFQASKVSSVKSCLKKRDPSHAASRHAVTLAAHLGPAPLAPGPSGISTGLSIHWISFSWQQTENIIENHTKSKYRAEVILWCPASTDTWTVQLLHLRYRGWTHQKRGQEDSKSWKTRKSAVRLSPRID